MTTYSQTCADIKDVKSASATTKTPSRWSMSPTSRAWRWSQRLVISTWPTLIRWVSCCNNHHACSWKTSLQHFARTWLLTTLDAVAGIRFFRLKHAEKSCLWQSINDRHVTLYVNTLHSLTPVLVIARRRSSFAGLDYRRSRTCAARRRTRWKQKAGGSAVSNDES